MRRTREPKWIYSVRESTEVKDLAGLALSSDFCSEHEWGVKKMKADFGVTEDKDGLDRRLIRRVPEHLRLVSGKGYDAIFFVKLYSNTPDDWMKWELYRYSSSDSPALVCAWDEESFGIVAYGKKKDPDRTRLRKLWEAFQAQDIAFWTNVGVFHIGGGLIFAIASKLDEADKAKMLESDLDHGRLIQAAFETRVETVLEKAGKRWFALAPSWANEAKTEVQFFLNPYDQRNNNSGWFTVDELNQWANNTGPVPKKAT